MENRDIILSKEMKSVINAIQNDGDLQKALAVISFEIGECQDYACTGLESRKYKIHRGGLVSALLGAYKQLILKELQFDTN